MGDGAEGQQPAVIFIIVEGLVVDVLARGGFGDVGKAALAGGQSRAIGKEKKARAPDTARRPLPRKARLDSRL